MIQVNNVAKPTGDSAIGLGIKQRYLLFTNHALFIVVPNGTLPQQIDP